jgi:regulatory protein
LKDSPADAKRYALKLLGYRGRSEKELRDRLGRKGIDEHVISLTVDHLKRLGYIDDRSLAHTLKLEALSHRKLSLRGARSFLIRRGIPVSLANEVLSAEEDRDDERAAKLVERKLEKMADLPLCTKRRRIYAFLLRRGYSAGTVVRLFNDYNLKEDKR